jgi:hypothetical protein
MNFIFANSFIDYNIKPTYLKKLPICPINFNDINDVHNYHQLITYVDRIQSLQNEILLSRMIHDKAIIQRQIDTIDNRIDSLVYQLYGLTEDEIKIVKAYGAINSPEQG